MASVSEEMVDVNVARPRASKSNSRRRHCSGFGLLLRTCVFPYTQAAVAKGNYFVRCFSSLLKLPFYEETEK